MAGTKPGDVYAAELYQPDAQAADVTLEGPAIPQGRVVKIEAMIIVDVTTGIRLVGSGMTEAELSIG